MTIALAVITLFVDALPERHAEQHETRPTASPIENASSTPYTLKVMTWVAVVMTPIVLVYQAWTFWVFRRRIGAEDLPPDAVSVRKSVTLREQLPGRAVSGAGPGRLTTYAPLRPSPAAGMPGRLAGCWSALGLLALLQVALAIALAALIATTVTAVFVGRGGLSDISTELLAAARCGRAARRSRTYAQESLSARASARVKAELAEQVVAHVARLGPGWLVSARRSRLVVLLTSGLDALDEYFARYLPQLVASSCTRWSSWCRSQWSIRSAPSSSR